MEKISFKDDTIALITYDGSKKYGKFTRFIPSDGKFVVVLPYRKKRGTWEFLLVKEKIHAWSSNLDHAGLSLPLKYQASVTASHLMKTVIGLEIKQDDFMYLGVVCGSKYSADTTHLFALNMTNQNDLELPQNCEWVSEDILIGSVDAVLLSAYVRLLKFNPHK